MNYLVRLLGSYYKMYRLIALFISITAVFSENTPIQGIDTAQVEELQHEIDKLQEPYLYSTASAKKGVVVHTLVAGIEKLLMSPGHKRLEIFCYPGEKRGITSLLKTVELVLKVPQDNFQYYEGVNVSSIQSQYDDQSWFSFTTWRPSSFRLNIYNTSCIGIETIETFRVHLKIRYVDLWRVLTLSLGMSLFLTAPLLAHNVLFHYVTGVSVGVCGSLLVLVFLASRLVPKKTGALAVLVGGWGMVLYTLQYLWTNSLNLIKEYQTVAAGYVALASLVSFAMVYRWGPVKDERSLRLVQWALQLGGLTLVFFSSQCKEFSLAIAILLVTHYNIPLSWKFKIRTLWLRRFPPKQKLLTEEEYMEQSRVETKKAMKELREHCRSPECNAWKTMSRLESPQRFAERANLSPGMVNPRRSARFAEYVEGGFHLTNDEILAYESSTFSLGDEDLLTTDEDDSEEDVAGATSIRRS